MTRRPTAALAMLATLLAVTVLVASPGYGLAADPVAMEARAQVAGRFEAGGWAAISVRLANDGEPVTGYVAADGEDGTVRRLVELPAGSRKEVTLYLRPESFARTVAVRFETSDGEPVASAEADVAVLERTSATVAVVGDVTGILRPQLMARDTGIPEPVAMTPADITERPEPMRGLETILWAGDSSTLTEAQRRSLERWIAAGGQLVVVGGPDWQARTAAFEAFLPVEDLRSVDEVGLAPLATWVAHELPPEGVSASVSLGQLRSDAVALVGTGDDVLLASVVRGAGRVSWLGVDLATEAFRAWPGAPGLWQRLLPNDRAAEQFGAVPPLEEEVAGLMVQALSNLPALDVPPAELLLAVLVGYILLIGPLSYLALRRLDRRELAWVTAPILVLVFSSVSYGIGASMKGSDVILNEVAVVRTTTDGTAASVSSFAGVFSPTRRAYDITVAGEALFSRLVNPFDGTQRGGGLATEQGHPSRLRGLSVSVFGLEGIRADTLIPYTPALSVTWSFTSEGIRGSATNTGEEPMEDVALVTEGGGAMVGTLDAGQTKEFALSMRGANQRSASEQIYGQVSGVSGSDTQRRIALRRQVIDTLVGYGGWTGRLGGGLSGIDRGPYVIGWRQGAAPVAMEVDGERAQHYVQAVEVVSGRPRLGPGAVTILPAHISTDVLELIGDANEAEPGYVVVGEGEAVFGMTLPLEATGLAASSITLLAGSDPSMVVSDQPNFGAALPPGYTLSVWDNLSSSWEEVGDLAARSRFELEQPGGLIDASGRIVVKITGTEVDPNFGASGVFVGAVVEGVI
ncbi:MAG TPA: hypothetical protein VHK28_08585 [Candidatus Limnocylindria bacterium]|nr:hypothetical protein [Candidatus Limnocylindria bacterium]